MKEIEVRTLKEDGNHELFKALAVISIVRTEKGVKLVIQENGELTEEFWRALPDALNVVIDDAMEARRATVEKEG